MRVISGIYKGRKLESPENYDIRPTTDKAKEALFSILYNELPGARVLDVFAGTGALGIEALSRGAAECIFVDGSRQAVALTKRNLAHCGAQENARVLAGDYRKVLSGLSGAFDIILMDPPYNKGLLADAMEIISQRGLLAEEGVIVCEHRKEEELPERIGGFTREKERRYGIVKLSIYR
ncbi:MAG: 16S rRNA (guanine(966)-N(2))-methyltransferase RsmD [Firmicutes bacterium]|nr:16S rRNA (guanine(966)-N(2))-methyltransferase RsmD [Bacillota bacterium]